ncbi:MAG: hypothetical protein Q9222_003080 [Ikaeria aurantiellina]
MHPFVFIYQLLVYLIAFSLISCTSLSPQLNCSTCLPNPIATTYPGNVTGVINATTAVIIVPLSYARALLPIQFANSILTHSYTRFNIPPHKYPLVIDATIDHDIRFGSIGVAPDFSAFRTTFPFIDRLGDGYSNFRYTGDIYLPPSNIVAINGSKAYGYDVLPGYFDPADAPYAFVPHSKKRITYFDVYTNDTTTHPHRKRKPIASTRFRSTGSHIAPIPLAFYRNITNQPMFGNNTAVCDQMINFWNTSVTTGAYEPQGVIGEVKLTPPLVPKKRVFGGVKGVKAERAFLENNYLSCESLKGYGGTGEGDSG